VLDVKFISTSNRDLLQFGTNWSLGGNGGLSLTSTFLNPSSAVPPAGGAAVSGLITKLPFGLGSELAGSNPQQYFLTNYDMTMAMRAFKNDRYSKTVQEPSITVVNNHEATLFVGDTISYPEVSAVTGQLGGIEFSLKEASKSPVKTGFQLYVIPKIVTAENKILLTIIPQFTFLSGALENNPAAVPGFTRFSLVSNGNPQSIDLPRVKETTVVSKMVVENGRTAVLGGLITETSSYADQGIPVLKDLPIVSYLFKSRTDDVAKEYLLIFITPRIVRSGSQVAEGFQRLLQVREESERAEYERMRKESQEQK
jgi:type II secretory pathway component GspD/PulD (secretin)